jgi:hypothetical protein
LLFHWLITGQVVPFTFANRQSGRTIRVRNCSGAAVLSELKERIWSIPTVTSTLIAQVKSA